jgi:TonB family protein
MFQGAQAERRGDTALAEQLYQKALLDAPADPAALLLYARVLKNQNRQSEAAVFEKRAQDALQTTPAPAPDQPGLQRIGNGVRAPKLLHKVEPSYSDLARAAKWQGTTILNVVVGTDGTAQSIHVKRALGLGLDDNAIAAVKQWRFEPATRDGQPVPVMATIEVNFRLL